MSFLGFQLRKETALELVSQTTYEGYSVSFHNFGIRLLVSDKTFPVIGGSLHLGLLYLEISLQLIWSLEVEIGSLSEIT